MSKGNAVSSSSEARTREPLDAKQLFDGHREVAIRFGNEIYRLRITRNDKLILTK